MSEIMLLGDSIACGLTYDSAAGKYALCRDAFAQALRTMGVNVKNLARIGCTIDTAQTLFEKAPKHEGAILAVELGGNDSDLNWSEVAQNPDIYHEAKVALNDFKLRLTGILEAAKKACMKPVVVTPLPVAARKYFEWFSKNLDSLSILRYLGSIDYIYRWQERYALAAQSAAASVNCPIFDLRSIFLLRKDFEDLMCEDGIHPTAQGQALIRDEVVKYYSAHVPGSV